MIVLLAYIVSYGVATLVCWSTGGSPYGPIGNAAGLGMTSSASTWIGLTAGFPFFLVGLALASRDNNYS